MATDSKAAGKCSYNVSPRLNREQDGVYTDKEFEVGEPRRQQRKIHTAPPPNQLACEYLGTFVCPLLQTRLCGKKHPLHTYLHPNSQQLVGWLRA